MKKANINKPKQTRSQRTLESILSAAERLLETTSFNDLTIQQIVKEAGSSVGSFYARFKDKEALLHALDDRYFDELIGVVDSVLADPAWQSLTLTETVQKLAELTVQVHQNKKGVARTLILQARLTPDPRYREREDRLWQSFPQLLELVLKHRDEIKHPQVETAVQLGFLQIYFAAREFLLWTHITDNLPDVGTSLANELAHMYLNYLCGTTK